MATCAAPGTPAEDASWPLGQYAVVPQRSSGGIGAPCPAPLSGAVETFLKGISADLCWPRDWQSAEALTR